MSMRERVKTHATLYPKWLRKEDSPARQCKKRDGGKCIVCGVKDRTLVYVDGEPHHFLYLYAAHLCPLDPEYDQIEPIEGYHLRAMCPKHARAYDVYWKPRWEEFLHQRQMHRILLDKRFDGWLMDRFMTVQ